MSRSGTGRVTLTRKHSFWGDYPPRGTLGVVSTPLFLSRDPRTAAVVRRMPPLTGAPVRVDVVRALRDRRGPVHAASFLRQRRIALDCTRAEFPRIFVHEVAHFIWLRLGNPARFGYERVLRAEIAETVAPPSEVEDELRNLFAALSA